MRRRHGASSPCAVCFCFSLNRAVLTDHPPLRPVRAARRQLERKKAAQQEADNEQDPGVGGGADPAGGGGDDGEPATWDEKLNFIRQSKVWQIQTGDD